MEGLIPKADPSIFKTFDSCAITKLGYRRSLESNQRNIENTFFNMAVAEKLEFMCLK